MVTRSRVLTILCFWALLGQHALGDVAENTRNTIQLVSSMEAYQQKMTREFLMVAYGMNVSDNEKYLADSIGIFDVALTDLERGNANGGIIAPPNPGVQQQLADIMPKWTAYKDLLERTYNTVLIWHKGFIASEASDPALVEAILSFKRGWNSFAATDAERLSGLQAAYINENQHPAGSKDQLDFAPGSEEYHAIHKQYHPKYRSILYDRNYYDIFMFDLEGNLVYSVYKELDYATNFAINGMGEWKNSGLGEAFEGALANPDVITVIDWKPYGPSNGALASFLSTGIKQDGVLVGVFSTQLPPDARPKDPTEWLSTQKASISKQAADSALPDVMEAFQQGWNSFAANDAQRQSGLQAAYITNNEHPAGSKDKLDFAPGSEAYHAVHKKYHPQYRDILYDQNYYDIFMFDLKGNLVYSVYKELDYATNFAISGAGQWKASGLGEAFEGALADPDGITVIDWKPYGPSNGALASFLSTGIKKNGVLIGVFCTQMPPEARLTQALDLRDIERENTGLLASVHKLLQRYTSHARFSGIALAPTSVTFATSQLLTTQQIVKEALFAILDVKRTDYLKAMQVSARRFEDVHTSLVWGDTVSGLPALSKICTLHSMLKVGEELRNLQKYLKLLRDTEAIAVSRELLSKLALVQKRLENAMEDAVHFFRTDDGVDPAAEVAKHKSYTAAEASDPELADAILAFKRGWNSFAATDAERLSGLQAAYITENQHPTGSKDQLDFAPGSEDYHAIHKQYHPKYRSILYDRNYYDIFMLDLEGNLIYSVYKELDYATNFARNGTGQWKSSGLGDAYEAALTTPDVITVIDWKPYGPSYGALASFLSTGIKKNGELVGVFTTQLPPEAKPICSVLPSISAQQWGDAIAETGKQRMLVQKATRVYLQVMKGVDVETSRIDFVLTVGDATASMRKTLKGYDTIPAPPTQAIANLLLDAWGQWESLDQEMKVSLESSDASFTVLSKVMRLSRAIDNALNAAVEQYVLSAVAAQPALHSIVWGFSQKQASLLHRMAVEALFIRFGISVDVNVASFAESIGSFEVAHWELLEGRSVSVQTLGSFLSDKALPRTTDACTLNAMEDVMSKFWTMKASLQQVIASKTTASEHAAVRTAYHLGNAVSDAMATAIDFYATGSGTCTLTHSTTAWEVTLDELSRLPYLFNKVQSEFALIEAGLSETWLRNAADDLVNHKGFIQTEAADPKLVDAFLAFKRGWDSFRPTNAERLLSLQVAYITLNEHPAGSKDQLDYAPGPEEYHRIHKQYHPTYRSILYARNYYDIFMLDLEGNLIYSVYKELDYATNFAANGTIDEQGRMQYGEWKDSGLGEAFDAAVRHPDIINVIDWKPYGPSYGALASFLSTGIKRNGQLVGVFCTQMPPESKPINSTQVLEQTMQTIEDRMRNFKYGKTEAYFDPPMSQKIANKLFEVSDRWDEMEHIAEGLRSRQSLVTMMSQRVALTSAVAALEGALLEEAWSAAPSLQGAKIVLANKQLALLQAMCRDSVMMTKSGLNITNTDIAASMNNFEANHRLLIQGGSVRRLAAKTDVAATTDPTALDLMQKAETQWLALKPALEAITTGAQATETVLRTVVESTASVIGSMDSAATYWGSTTRTTTMMTLEILAPAPFTGDWPAGQTLRLAAQLAEGLINEEQHILPGYKLKHAFYDDKCDASRNSQVVLAEMSAKDTYIALGGTGCSKACAATASVASSIRLPFLSYECSSDFDPQLSDTNTYPDLTRMGTVTTPVIDVIKNMGNKFGWEHIIVISGDRSKYKDLAEERKRNFESLGFSSEYKAAEQDSWNSIQTVMSEVKETTKGKHRVVFFIGTETFFRKAICASITEGLEKGIIWLTEGTWRHEWWSKIDVSTPLHRQWLVEDVSGKQLKDAFAEFKQAWDSFTPAVADTRSALQRLYATTEKDALISVDGPETYHDAHRKWHPTYRKLLYERGYYDIFIFDTSGDMIYSVYKESDYATNFKATGNGRWKDSGLGNAFEAAMASPDEVHYIDWKPYGPSGDAPAAFFSTGLRDKDGLLIGVYSIQLPPEFERSIGELEPQCKPESIVEAFEGAVNVAGLGRPTDENLEKPLKCFKSHSAKSFSRLIDSHLASGYPTGNLANRVVDPYYDIKAHAVDATCALAFAVKHMLGQGHTIQQIQRLDESSYDEFKRYLKNELDFQGVSGRVNFSDNNRPNTLVVKQILQGKEVEVGLVLLNGTLSWIGNGTINSAWAVEPEDPPERFKYWLVFQIGLPTLLVCCTCGVSIHLTLKRYQNTGQGAQKSKASAYEDTRKIEQDSNHAATEVDTAQAVQGRHDDANENFDV